MRNKKLIKMAEENSLQSPSQKIDFLKQKCEEFGFQSFFIVKDKNSGFFSITLNNVEKNNKEFLGLILMGFCKWVKDVLGKSITATIINKQFNKVLFNSDFLSEDIEK